VCILDPTPSHEPSCSLVSFNTGNALCLQLLGDITRSFVPRWDLLPLCIEADRSLTSSSFMKCFLPADLTEFWRQCARIPDFICHDIVRLSTQEFSDHDDDLSSDAQGLGPDLRNTHVLPALRSFQDPELHTWNPYGRL
jgi:hypothetical protein